VSFVSDSGRKATATHPGSLFWTIPSVSPNAFDANPGAIEGPLVHITITSRGKWVGTNVEEARRACVRRWEYAASATYASELTQTLPKSATGRIEAIESLSRFTRRVRKGDAATYLVQIVYKPHQIVALKVRHALLVLLSVKNVAELVVKVGRGPVEEIEWSQGWGYRHEERPEPGWVR
jgi:hypothetical protein